jgi:putative drug exporter of the RND superfamily
VFGKAAAALPGARTASWVSTGDRAFVSADGRTTFELIYPVASFACIYALTYLTTMSTLVQNIVALVGLGVAIDYALLIVTRWREERGDGSNNRAAVLRASLRASATAGNSVLFSGITVAVSTVAVSLAALALITVPFLRSIGLAVRIPMYMV